MYHDLKERNDTSIVGAAWQYQGVYCSKSGMHGCCRCCSGLWTTDSICTATPRSRPTPWHSWLFLASLVSQSTTRTTVTASWHPPMWVSPIVFSCLLLWLHVRRATFCHSGSGDGCCRLFQLLSAAKHRGCCSWPQVVVGWLVGWFICK